MGVSRDGAADVTLGADAAGDATRGTGGARGWLTRLAAADAVPVFLARGCGGRAAAAELAARPDVEAVPSPRQATLLVVVGPPPAPLLRPLLRVHDQVPPPRATVLWEPDRGPTPEPASGPRAPGAPSFGGVTRLVPGARRFEAGLAPEGAAPALRELHAGLLAGALEGEPIAQPDVPPAPWRGVGPHGQGGEGMMGGRPYGRPMPGRGPDRDGLALERLPLRVGPFFPPFPPGLTLRPVLQGDLVQELEVAPVPFPEGRAPGPFARALERAVPVAELEAARARSHLLWLRDALELHGLAAAGERAVRIAADVRADDPAACAEGAERVRRLGDRVAGRWGLRAATRGVGKLPPETAAALGGPVARAAGVPADARGDDPAYRALDFDLLVGGRGDAAARRTQRIDEAVQALALASRAAAGEVTREPGPPVETPRGPLGSGGEAGGGTAAALDRLPGLLAGQEWGDAMTTLVSLDLDLEAAAARRGIPSGDGGPAGGPSGGRADPRGRRAGGGR